MREVTVIERNDSVFVRVVDGSTWEQKMYDLAEAYELKLMLEHNPDVAPFEIFKNWLIFKFPNGLHGTTREERQQPVGDKKFSIQ